MVVLMFASNDRCYRMAFRCYSLGTATLELSTLLLQTSLDSRNIAMMVFTVFNTGHTMLVLLGENLTILDRLDRGVIMILVDLAVDSSLSLFMALLDNVLLNDGWSDLFVDSGIMMTGLVPERQKLATVCRILNGVAIGIGNSP